MKYFEGIGRRKTSTARVRIYNGKKASTVNGKPLDEYVSEPSNVKKLMRPLIVTNNDADYYFTAQVQGGGTSGQTGAIQLGIARALINMEAELKPKLRQADLVTRDPRMVERKKYNQKKARRKHQFSKR